MGVFGYGVNLGVFAGLYAAGIRYIGASIVSYFVSNALMYLGNRYFTFRLGHEGFWSAYLRYILVGGVIAGLNVALLAALVEDHHVSVGFSHRTHSSKHFSGNVALDP